LIRHDAPASGSRLIAPGVLGASAGVLEGETFWYLDDSLNLWRVEPGSSPRQVTSMPAALAGHFPHGGMVSPGPGRVLTALTLDPEGLEDGDEVAALLETDAGGTWVMRGREEDSFLSMAIADGRIWVSTSLGVFEVSP
jgi:hypothetical protein